LSNIDKDQTRASDWSSYLSTLRELEQGSKRAQAEFELANEIGAIICDIMPSQIALGAPNPAYNICWAVHLTLTIINFVIWRALDINLDIYRYFYEDTTISDSQLLDTHIAATDTFAYTKVFMPWAVDALGVMNQNIVRQHTTMRDELQKRHEQMEKALQKRHATMEINLNIYMMCMTNHLGISMLKMTYPSAKVEGLSSDCLETLGLEGDGRRRLRALEEVEGGGDVPVPSQAPSSSETSEPKLPDVFQLQLTFSDGTTISSDPADAEESEESNGNGSGSSPSTASMHEMIKEMYESMNIISTSNGSNSNTSPQNDPFVSDSNAQWYVDWVSIVVVRLYNLFALRLSRAFTNTKNELLS